MFKKLTKLGNLFVVENHFCIVLSYFVLFLYSDSTGGDHLHNNETYSGQSAGESSLPLVAKILGSSLLALLCLSGVLWFALRYLRKRR